MSTLRHRNASNHDLKTCRQALRRPVRCTWMSIARDDRRCLPANSSLAGKIAKHWTQEVIRALAPANNNGTPSESTCLVIEHTNDGPKQDTGRNPATTKLHLHIPHVTISWSHESQ